MSAEAFGFIAAGRHAGEIRVRPRSAHREARLEAGQRVEYTLVAGS